MSKENKINYEALEEITVTSQAELDMIPDGFKGRIYIEFGVRWDRAVLARVFPRKVVAWGNASVEARGNASVEAWENASVVAWENASVEARENASVVAWGNASVEARENASVEARENASVEARENASVVAGGNVQVVEGSSRARIQISGNARIVYYPKNIEDFMNFYGIKHDKKTAIFYKAVHRREIDSSEGLALIPNNKVAGKPPVEYRYVSDRISSFEYPIGAMVSEKCDPDVSDDCSYGIHISHLGWALDFGRDWADMAIIEVETKIKDIVLPTNTNGKVRTSEVKVLREVPLEKCGVFGKILAKRRNK